MVRVDLAQVHSLSVAVIARVCLEFLMDPGGVTDRARNSRLVISDISCCPGRVRFDCRQHLSSLGCTCVCSPVDIMDFKHGLQRAAAVENFVLPPGCKFDIVILYGISYGTHGPVTGGVDAQGVEEQRLRSPHQWSRPVHKPG